MPDSETIALYDARAQDYATQFSGGRDPRLVQFIALMPAEARVLDLGCGPGRAAAQMALAGLDVDALDASSQMVTLANQHRGVRATCADFNSLDAVGLYDGIWANFSLLHAPRDQMPSHITAVATALKPRGWFAIGLKMGEGEKRDALGRFYTYYKDAEISRIMESVGLTIATRDFGAQKGFEGVHEPWIVLTAQKTFS